MQIQKDLKWIRVGTAAVWLPAELQTMRAACPRRFTPADLVVGSKAPFTGSTEQQLVGITVQGLQQQARAPKVRPMNVPDTVLAI
jgi:hypothetical protein